MEAASIPAAATPLAPRVRSWISNYGLIIVLLALPAVFLVHDLLHDHNAVRTGQNIVAGISNGSILALVASGYTLVYGIVELINFAHGDVFMLGSFVAASFWGAIAIHAGQSAVVLFFGLIVTLIVAMAVAGSLNVLIEKVAYRPLRSAPKLAPLITAVGMSFILENVGLLWKGGNQQGVPDLINAQHTLVTILGVPI